MRSRLMEPVEIDTVRPSGLGRSSRRGQSRNGHTRPVLSESLEAQLIDRGRTKAGLPKIAPIVPNPMPEDEEFFRCSNKGSRTLN